MGNKQKGVKKKDEGKKFDVLDHQLVPKHEILSEKEEKEVLKKYGIDKKQLPYLLITDPVAMALGAKVGQIVRITRDSQSAGKAVAYRLVAIGIEAEEE